MSRTFRELTELDRLLGRLGDRARVSTLATVEAAQGSWPIQGIALGTTDRRAPTLAIVGGVHGLERIGTRVVLAYLHTLSELLDWDSVLHAALERSRLVFVPLVNPGGLFLRQRANPSGVDLMRNAPVHPESHGTPLLGGQRISPRLPWYMGRPDQAMEVEARALCDFMERELFGAEVAVACDVHSGFGFVDRLWFPYARTRRPFHHLPEMLALTRLLDATLPNHVYAVEPQARSYTIAGDLWDHLYDRFRAVDPERVFIPLTLEMGSWTWLKKNPRQALHTLGGFNPLVPHRLARTLRRHLPLFDFLHRATASPSAWARPTPALRPRLAGAAFERFYG